MSRMRLTEAGFLRLAVEHDQDAKKIAEITGHELSGVRARISRARRDGKLPGGRRPRYPRSQIIAAVNEHGGNQSEAARALGIDVSIVNSATAYARRIGEGQLIKRRTTRAERAQLYLERHPYASAADVGAALGVDTRQAEQILVKLRNQGRARVTLPLSPYPAELAVLEQAAARAGVSVTVFALNAALSVAREQQPQAYTPHQLQHLWRAREASGEPWALDEVTARGLPLYWVPGWLAGQIEAGETLNSIASRHGYNARTVSNHAKRQGITLRRVIRFDQCGPWPASVADVAARAFDDQHDDAARWLSEQVANGYLRRVQRGVYDLKPPTSP